jgi:hypothetical protein
MGDRALVIGALLVGLIIGAIVWFVAISPKLSSASNARDEAFAQEDQNFNLEQTLLKRQKSAENEADYYRELYHIRDLLPPTEDVPGVRVLIDDIASDIGVTVQQERLSQAVPIVGGLSLAAPMEEVGLTSEIEGMLFGNLLATEFSIEFETSMDKILRFFDEVRNGDHRYILINSLSYTVGDDPSKIKVTIGVTFFTLDNGDPLIHVRPPERPWPGSEEEDEQSGIGSDIFNPVPEPTAV